MERKIENNSQPVENLFLYSEVNPVSIPCIQIEEKEFSSAQMHQHLKILAQNELDARSTVYAMKRKANRTYIHHLRMVKPVLNRYPNFWRMLDESEKNAKGFEGLINHLEYFYHMIIQNSKYSRMIFEQGVDLNELRKGQLFIHRLQQAYQHLRKCKCENKRSTSRC